jgi:hypothetical protein
MTQQTVVARWVDQQTVHDFRKRLEKDGGAKLFAGAADAAQLINRGAEVKLTGIPNRTVTQSPKAHALFRVAGRAKWTPPADGGAPKIGWNKARPIFLLSESAWRRTQTRMTGVDEKPHGALGLEWIGRFHGRKPRHKATIILRLFASKRKRDQRPRL